MYSGTGGNGMAISMNMMNARNDRRGKRAELPEEIARKLKSCSVLNCEDWRDLNSYTTYHCFPTGDKNQERWEIWTQLLRKAREDDSWIPFRGSLVCSHHFRSEDFVSDAYSKRRKLIKNAIPSIFPTFTVDLDDPSYQVQDDGNDDLNGNTEDYDSSYVDTFGEEAYEFEYASAEDGDGSNVMFDEIQNTAVDDDDIQVLDAGNQIQFPMISIQRSQACSSGTARANSSVTASSVGKIKLLSTPSIVLQPQPPSKQVKKAGPPQLVQIPPNQVIHFNGRSRAVKTLLQSIPSDKPSNAPPVTNSSLQCLRQKSVQSKQIAGNTLDSLPFSLNPDLEIEMVDPEEDLAFCKNRITELEQQNQSLTTMYENALEALKQKYENQLVFLRKRLRDQEKILNLHQVNVANNMAPIKRKLAS